MPRETMKLTVIVCPLWFVGHLLEGSFVVNDSSAIPERISRLMIQAMAVQNEHDSPRLTVYV